tara:strand:- start:82 stop:558 length:477 start_codon:yes stop_codon:yes gene_type:complete
MKKHKIVALWEDYIYYPIYRGIRWKVWDKIRPGKIKHYYQRAKTGHSYMDAWSIDYYLVDNLIPMLNELKKNKHSVATTFFRKKDGVDKNGNPTDEAFRLAEQRFDNVLNEILYGLKCAKKIHEVDYNYKDKDEGKKLKKSAERSFQLIGKHLFSLWD